MREYRRPKGWSVLKREQWAADVAQLTEPHRERRARALLARGAALAIERRKAFRLSGKVGRTERGRPAGAAPLDSAWHTARALTKRRLFEKVAECGEGHTLELICRNGSCGERFTVPLGCGQAFFCPECRKRRANAFRVDFQRKQLGLVGTAQRAGLLHRYRRRSAGGRFSERLFTVTVPHLSEDGETFNVRERIEHLRATWDRFNRLFRDELRGKLRGLKSGITINNTAVGLPMPRGKAAARDELDLFELVNTLRVFEWTPGDDGKGHPHYHVWLFSPYLDHWHLRWLWARAYADVMQPTRVCILPIADVRGAEDCEGGNVANELVKYLTKDWYLTSDGAKRVAPEVFAELYTLVDGTRTRQSSQGLAHWSLPKAKECPCCAYTSERQHWARVHVNHAIAEQATARTRAVLEWPETPTPGVAPRTERTDDERPREAGARDPLSERREGTSTAQVVRRSDGGKGLRNSVRKLRGDLGPGGSAAAPLGAKLRVTVTLSPTWRQCKLPL